MTETTSLIQSLDALADIAAEAGLDPAAARTEGLRVAAALAESVPGAASGWAEAAGLGTAELGPVNTAFFEAASLGRRWRAHPTELLETLVASGNRLAQEYAVALTEVASSAVMLGTAPIWVIANATAAAGVYLGAARVPVAPPSTGPVAPPAPPQTGVLAANRTGAVGGAAPDSVAAQAGPTGAPPAEPEPAEPEKSVEELLAELDAMIGLDRVKREIHRQVALLTVEKMRVDAGLKPNKLSRHLIFVGNPGTGKTTVARLIGAIYRAIGLLDGGQLVEVDRSELVAGYVGQTAMKTAEVCAKAVGGVLFIDEAYALTGDQYAQEAVNTLVKEMEDHREDLVVIVAGYPDPMVGFIAQNPGLASRFTTTIEFDDYTDDELMAILDSIATGADYELSDDAAKRVRMTLEATPRGPSFGNGRFSRNLFEHAVGRHAWRLKDATEPTVEELRLLTAADFIEQPDDPDPRSDPEADPGPAADSVREGPDGAFAETPAGSNDGPSHDEPDHDDTEHDDHDRNDHDRNDPEQDEQHVTDEEPA